MTQVGVAEKAQLLGVYDEADSCSNLYPDKNISRSWLTSMLDLKP